MAVIRKKRFAKSGNRRSISNDLIDSPEKLLAFAQQSEIATKPLDAQRVAEALSIEVTYRPLPNNVSGSLRLETETGVWQMTVNADHHQNRQRYTIAHELGHYCLHRYTVKEFEDYIFFRASALDKMEWEANEFAGCILMPEDIFRGLVRGDITSVDALAREFGVSTLALRIRAKQLGFSGHGL